MKLSLTERPVVASAIGLLVALVLTWLVRRALRTGRVERAGVSFYRSTQPFMFYFLVCCMTIAASILYFGSCYFALKGLR